MINHLSIGTERVYPDLHDFGELITRLETVRIMAALYPDGSPHRPDAWEVEAVLGWAANWADRIGRNGWDWNWVMHPATFWALTHATTNYGEPWYCYGSREPYGYKVEALSTLRPPHLDGGSPIILRRKDHLVVVAYGVRWSDP